MIVAPLVMLTSSIVSLTGLGNNSDAEGGTLVVYASLLLIFVILGLTNLLSQQAPLLATLLRITGIWGCVGGVGWGMDSAIRGTLLTQVDAATARLSAEAVFGNLPLLLEIPGLVMPLSFAILGISLWRTKLVPAPVGILLALAGLTFPIGRIPDIAPVIYATDILFIVSLGWISWQQFMTSRKLPNSRVEPTAVAAS